MQLRVVAVLKLLATLLEKASASDIVLSPINFFGPKTPCVPFIHCVNAASRPRSATPSVICSPPPACTFVHKQRGWGAGSLNGRWVGCRVPFGFSSYFFPLLFLLRDFSPFRGQAIFQRSVWSDAKLIDFITLIGKRSKSFAKCFFFNLRLNELPTAHGSTRLGKQQIFHLFFLFFFYFSRERHKNIAKFDDAAKRKWWAQGCD